MHRLVAKYFLKNEFDGYAEVEGEPLEVHHILPESTFAEDEPFKANRSDNLQILPKSVHRDVSHIDRFEKKISEQDTIPVYLITPQLIQAIQKHIEDGKLAYIVQKDDNKATARPLKKEPGRRTNRRIKFLCVWGGVLSSTVLLKNIGVIE